VVAAATEVVVAAGSVVVVAAASEVVVAAASEVVVAVTTEVVVATSTEEVVAAILKDESLLAVIITMFILVTVMAPRKGALSKKVTTTLRQRSSSRSKSGTQRPLPNT
jgi:hypothetical protein